WGWPKRARQARQASPKGAPPPSGSSISSQPAIGRSDTASSPRAPSVAVQRIAIECRTFSHDTIGGAPIPHLINIHPTASPSPTSSHNLNHRSASRPSLRLSVQVFHSLSLLSRQWQGPSVRHGVRIAWTDT
ncbi:hypothetical protein CPAR01_03529, partial [Colletotrichum paranaense]